MPGRLAYAKVDSLRELTLGTKNIRSTLRKPLSTWSLEMTPNPIQQEASVEKGAK